MKVQDLAQVRVFPNAVDAEEIREICLAHQELAAKADYARDDVRKGSVRWVSDHDLTRRMWHIVRDLNREFYHFDLQGILEPLQYAKYEVGDHFGWHVDAAAGQEPYRKLALSIQLTPGDEYEGGELQMQLGCWTMQMPTGPGDIIAFPSWTPHRVLPVSRGTREALVVWAHGKPFR